MLVEVEVCINCDGPQFVTEAVGAAYRGGAATVELCGAMAVDGLTPRQQHIRKARQAFKGRKGLMVMVRPRAGDFHFSGDEFELMKRQVVLAAELGADGVVFGMLGKDNQIADHQLGTLVKLCQRYQLVSTFHRAFDATPEPLTALQTLIDAGVDRVLTSGTRWGSGQPASEGIETLRQLIILADNRIEVVIGGGVKRDNIPVILGALPVRNRRIAVHAYSGVLWDGGVVETAVRRLVEAANALENE